MNARVLSLVPELKRYRTPHQIQDFLDGIAINHEKEGETCMSPARVLREQKAHCLEGALFAAACLWAQGERPLLMNLRTTRGDDFHAVALFQSGGYWGAISKTNHAVLRFRDPIYRDPRELASSFFHEYFLGSTGRKTLRGYTAPVSMRQFGYSWLTDEADLWHIADTIATLPHHSLVPEGVKLRPATLIERSATDPVEWSPEDPRT